MSGEVTVATSNGRITATLTKNGQNMDAGSADYAVSGTELRFSNLSAGGMNYFSILNNLLTIGGALGGSDCFYKSSGGKDPDPDPGK